MPPERGVRHPVYTGIRYIVVIVGNQTTTPVVPRPAATVIIVRDDPFEVLLVLRSAASSFFPAAYVFPGGRVEEHDHSDRWLPLVEHHDLLTADERAFRIAAVRETHEEASILLADGLVPDTPGDGEVDGADGAPIPVPPAAPDAVAFQELIAEIGARLLLDEVVPYAHWITPEIAPKRFDTRFYLTRAPKGQLAQADAAETEHVRWMSPAKAVEMAMTGDLALPPPTLLSLKLLEQTSTVAEAIAAAKTRTIIPILPKTATGADGALRLIIPEEAGYGLTAYEIPKYSASAESRPRSPR